MKGLQVPMESQTVEMVRECVSEVEYTTDTLRFSQDCSTVEQGRDGREVWL